MTQGNICQATKLLRMNRTNFYRYLEKYDINHTLLQHAALEGDPYSPTPEEESLSFTGRLNRHKRLCIAEALKRDKNNKSRAARALGITRRRVTYALRKRSRASP